MRSFTDAVRKAVTDQNWFAALFLALCLPDICGAIETPNEGNGVRYKRWFRTNLAAYLSMFSEEDAWHFRCACLHQGVDADARMAYSRVHFITPPPRNNVVHLNEFDGVLQMQIDQFCNDVANAVDDWYVNTASKDTGMNSRVRELIKIYGPESLRPYISFG